MNQLKMKNPQMFQMINQARNNNDNPIELFKQITGNYTPEQLDSFYKRAGQMGIPQDVLNKFK